ncbi:hypothetical protein KC345_g7790 [Hortaea werneckii]|nr:hypothetical protein KC345_g7790 [Hortaea werneckii]
MTGIKGHNDSKFDNVRRLLEKNLASGDELGASIVVNIDGKDVVDIWGGYADEAKTRSWESDTIVSVMSSTKTVLSLAALICHDRGLLDVYDKVSKYWPEFAANGKENIEVRHLLSHTSGLSGWEQTMTYEDVANLEYSTKKLAEQAPFWEPGTAAGYHVFTMGHLVGEVIRRVTGKSLTQFIREEIAEPLSADFQIGAAEKDWPRIADLVPPPVFALPTFPEDSVQAKSIFNPMPNAHSSTQPFWLKAEVGAGNGHGTALGLNRMLRSLTLGGTLDGKKLLSQKTIDLIFEKQFDGIDQNVGIHLLWGIGYGIAENNPATNWIPKGKVCFWGGWGGSMVVMDLDRRMTITYVMNKMGGGLLGNDRTAEYYKAIYNAVGIEME